ncbi:MAG TPA: class II aldolase/adducin family protein [Anaerolineae bacterium]|nr:class II aldolase/adducin family protein [Anaerolineae bacterium]
MSAREQQLRQQIVQIGQLMYQKGFICASDGNISARLGPNRILITPSGLHKGLLTTDQLLIVTDEGQVVDRSHDLRPTSELPMHLAVYRYRSDVEAVVHAHPPITIALSIANISLAECLLPEAILFLGLVPTTEYATPSSEENVRAIQNIIPNHDALILQRHGSLTVGRDPMQAFMRLETLEQVARVRYMLGQLGAHSVLPPVEAEKLLAQRQKLGLAHPQDVAEFCDICGVCHPRDHQTVSQLTLPANQELEQMVREAVIRALTEL